MIGDRGLRTAAGANLEPASAPEPAPSRHSLAVILADLHIHTVLSPCADVGMLPPLIVRQALNQGLGLIAITDHNAAANCEAVMRAAQGTDLAVLPGMEVQTSEEVHVVCLFATLEEALVWQGIVYDHLPDLPNPEETFGGQFVVDAAGDYIRTEARLLLTSTDLTLSDVVRRVRQLGGLVIPAHVDRPSFSLLANLGFVPPGLDVPALELFRLTDPATAIAQWPELERWPLIRGSDAHQLGEIRPGIRLHLEEAGLSELTLALARQKGRSFSLVP